MENPQPDQAAIAMTDDEIWQTIRYLDPDQPRNTTDVVSAIAIAVGCDVWICLVFAACKWLANSLELHGRFGR